MRLFLPELCKPFSYDNTLAQLTGFRKEVEELEAELAVKA